MTTPERLRRRQRRESIFIAVLTIALVTMAVVYRVREAADDRCIDAFIENQTETSKVRSNLVERESQATRAYLHGAGDIKSRADFEALIAAYDDEIAAIDAERQANPVKVFDRETTC